MKRLIKLTFVLLAVTMMTTSCTKETPSEVVCPTTISPVFDIDGNQYDNACLAEKAGVNEYFETSPEIVGTIWFDKTQTGNCKWFIRIGDQDYRMSNVDKDFYKDGLKVVVSYMTDLTPPDHACDVTDTYIDVTNIRINE